MILLPVLVAAQNVNIPDANFKAALVANTAINTNGDTEIQTDEAAVFSGAMDVNFKDISDMTGLEAFTSLTELDCSNNPSLSSLDMSANLSLRRLYCISNHLSSIDVSANTALESLACMDNQLTSLDISANTELTSLGCYSNQLTRLDVSANTKLTFLDCYINQLSSLDLSANTSLDYLNCTANQLTSLDLSKNTTLRILECPSNKLPSLDLSLNGQLEYLDCSSNQITRLDLNMNTSLTDLFCESNQLNSLDVRNGNNDILIELRTSNNPSLTCISVDDVAYAEANWTQIDDGTNFNLDCNFSVDFTADITSGDTPLTVQFTDATIGSPVSWSWDLDNDGIEDSNLQNPQYTYSNAGTYTVILTVEDENSYSSEIKTAFITVGGPIVAYFSADITEGNTPLEVQFSDESLGSVTSWLWDFGDGNTSSEQSPKHTYNIHGSFTIALTVNDGTNSDIETKIEYIDVSDQIVNIPDKNFKAALLTNVEININGDDEIQLSEAIAYSDTIDVNLLSINDLTGIEAFTSIIALDCSGNSLVSMDLSKNILLSHLNCYNNLLTSLDLRENTSLTKLNCGTNQLIHLDVQNANNDLFIEFNATDNLLLVCINVDDVAYSATNWINIDAGATFSSDGCNVYIPDPNFKSALLKNTEININGDEEIQISEAQAFSDTLDVGNKKISDMTGLEAFTKLIALYCSSNYLSSLDVSGNTKITTLNCAYNQLYNLDVSAITALTVLNCRKNQLGSLDLTSNPNLEWLNCNNNGLSSLDVNSNSALLGIDCSSNNLSSLDVSANTQLRDLFCSSNQLSSLDLSLNPKLRYLHCSYNKLSSLELSLNPKHYDLVLS